MWKMTFFQSCHWKNVLILISLQTRPSSAVVYMPKFLQEFLKQKDLILVTIGIGVLLIMIAPS